MAKERLINTRFWSDTWVREKLNPLDRYFLLYLLTNEHTNISGIYELPISIMAFETGLDKEKLSKTMFPNLKPKVHYKNSWVIITNFLKYQRTKSDKVVIGIVNALKIVPKPVLEFAKSIGYGYDIDMIWESYHILESELELKPEYKLKGSSFKKKPYFKGDEMRKKGSHWFVLPKDGGAWLEFAGEEKDIVWK